MARLSRVSGQRAIRALERFAPWSDWALRKYGNAVVMLCSRNRRQRVKWDVLCPCTVNWRLARYVEF